LSLSFSLKSSSSIDLGPEELSILFTPYDLKRLEAYANNMLDYHVILDLLPSVSSLYFQKRLGDEVRLTAVQSSILLALGLQRKTIEEVEVSLRFSHPLKLFLLKLDFDLQRQNSSCP